MNLLQRLLRSLLERLENLCERAFGPGNNPLGQLGALGWFLFWIVAGSGLYLYIFFDTGVTQAYESVEGLTHGQWWAGGIMRSLHRYASDGLVIVALLHLVREFALDRLRGPRVFGWITGLVVLGFTYVCGLTGYWMVWDRLAQYVALVTTEWLDVLPLFAGSIARNFLHSGELSGRFFTLMAYVHIAAPLLMLAMMWLHIQRLARARVNPTRPLAIAVSLALLALSLVLPAVSQGPANLDIVPASVGLDWFYLVMHPVVERLGGRTAWLIVAVTAVVCIALPWLVGRWRQRAAEVHLPDCNGCGRCVEDCPFGALTLVPRTDGLAFDHQVAVDPDRCVACGICAGACPTATPFRSATALIPGIQLPDDTIFALRERTIAAAAAAGPAPVVVYRCTNGAAVAAASGIAVVDVPCVGMVPPPFLDFVTTRRIGASVMLAGCREDACYQRLGGDWTVDRIARRRDPQLRERVSRDRVAVSWADLTQAARRAFDVAAFRAHTAARPAAGVAAAGRVAAGGVAVDGTVAQASTTGRAPASEAGRASAPEAKHASSSEPWRAPLREWPAAVRWGIQGGLLALLAAFTGLFSIAPAHSSLAPTEATVKLSVLHAGHRVQPCRELTKAEMARLPPNMRKPRDCPRARWPVETELWVNGELREHGVHQPAGLSSDGPSTAYARVAVPAGPVTITARLRDSGRREGWDYERTFTERLAPEASVAVDFRPDEGGFILRGAVREGGPKQ